MDGCSVIKIIFLHFWDKSTYYEDASFVYISKFTLRIIPGDFIFGGGPLGWWLSPEWDSHTPCWKSCLWVLALFQLQLPMSTHLGRQQWWLSGWALATQWLLAPRPVCGIWGVSRKILSLALSQTVFKKNAYLLIMCKRSYSSHFLSKFGIKASLSL